MIPTQTIEDYVGRFPRAGGFVYVLSNKAHPHLQKVGFTTRSPAERADELDTTGSPHPFFVAFALYHDNPRGAEERLHSALAAQRVRNEREFFELSLPDAVAIIMREFGRDADYFDPSGITPIGKSRLAAIQREAEQCQTLLRAINQWADLPARLADVESRLAKSRRRLYFRTKRDNAAEFEMQSEVTDLISKLECLDVEMLSLQRRRWSGEAPDQRILNIGDRLLKCRAEAKALHHRICDILFKGHENIGLSNVRAQLDHKLTPKDKVALAEANGRQKAMKAQVAALTAEYHMATDEWIKSDRVVRAIAGYQDGRTRQAQ